MLIAEIATELNRRAEGYEIGNLQVIRQRLRGLSRPARRYVFDRESIKDDYAFHYGGRTELQFNIGYEEAKPTADFRHGIAFSLEPGINLRDVTILFPQVRRFNEFVRQFPNEYGDMRLWFWRHGRRSPDLLPGEISEDVAQKDTFICLGKHYPPSQIAFDTILTDFDRLLPLYEFSVGDDDHPSQPRITPLPFAPGHTEKRSQTTWLRETGRIDVYLRQNVLQQQLYEELVAEYGSTNVRSEYSNALRKRIDLAVRSQTGTSYYEIKTQSSARACIREAIGQLLEYSYWPNADIAERLVIVGEPQLDDSSAAYLVTLERTFQLKIEYRQVVVE